MVLTGQPGGTDYDATVTGDFRLYVGRSVFEAHVFLRGQPMRGGDPVFVRVVGDTVTIKLDDDGDPANETFTLSATRGRVKIPNRTGAPFNPGDTYKVTVSPTEITVDLSQTV